MRCAHDMPFGALPSKGGANFRLWAPAAKTAALVLSPNAADERVVMAERTPGGFWQAHAERVAAGVGYRWRVDDFDVPDPASRFNPEGPHGPSVLVDPCSFEWDAGDDAWTGRPWHEVVLYQLHVGSFTTAGTFAAAEAHLPALAALGVTALQLMPLASWPGRFGWGYDGVLPFAPHAAYGSPQQLKHFIQAAHRLGLMVFVDAVYNHFGPDGNFLPRYAPNFFTERHHTAWGAAIDFADDTVREFFIHNALYWAEEYRVDGLRFDAVHAIIDERSPHFLEQLSQRVRSATAGRHVHLVLENDTNDADRLSTPRTAGRFDGQWSGDFHHALHVLLTGEREGYYAEYDRPLAQLARCATHGFAREGDPHRDRRDATSTVPLCATVNFLHNHDQIGNRAFGERLAALADPHALKLATALLLLGPWTPMLFMGEEMHALTPFLYFADWQGGLADAVRNGRVAEFSHFKRYAEAARKGELPDPCSEETFLHSKIDHAAAKSGEGATWRRRIGELLALRARELVPRIPSLSAGGHESHRLGEHGLRLHWRFDDGSSWQAIVNLGTHSLVLPRLEAGADLRYEVGDATMGRLGAWSGRWYAS